MRSCSIALATLLLLVVPFVTTPAPVAAQDVTYTTVTNVKMGGVAGRAMNFIARMGGGSTEVTETIHLKGNRMLRATDDSATLIDLDAEQITTIDHEAKTYSVITFEQLRQQLEAAAAEASEARAEANGDPGDSGTQTSVSFDLNVDPTGRQSTINGHDAEQYLMTLQIEGTATEEGSDEEQSGTMVVASDLWLSEALGNSAVEDFNRAFAEKFGEAVLGAAGTQNLAGALEQAFAGDPRIKEGMAKAQAEAAKMEGVEVKSTTHIVLVGSGQQFNPDLVFGQEEEKKEEEPKGGLLGRVRRMAQQQQNAEPADSEAAPTQQTLLTTVTELKDYSAASVDPSVFEIPSDYRQVSE